MADSIHDQWPLATEEWPKVTQLFNDAWVFVVLSNTHNPDQTGYAACINYLARMVQDSTVMAGDMITHLAQSDVDNMRGVIQNFQNLQKHVLPQWGVLAAAYAEARAHAWAAHEAANRVAADQLEAQQRTIGDEHSRQQAAAAVAAEQAARFAQVMQVWNQLSAAINAEAASRAAGDDHTRQQMAAAIKALNDTLTKQVNDVLKYAQSIPATIDQRAAAGYDPTLRSRGDLITKLLDTVTAHNPAVRGLVTNLAKFAIDLAGIEDPILRLAAQVVLKQVIDRLGIDSALSAMLNDLIGGILGGGQPKTLQTIMGDIGNRLDALEKGQAELSPLAPEADNLHEMGTLVFDAALLGYFTAAVADPVATANDTVAVLAPITGPLLAPVRALLGM